MDAASIHLALFAAFLGSPDFNQRELGTFHLKQSPPHVAALLAHSHDFEVASRAVRVARDQRRDWAFDLAYRMQPRQFNRAPWIDGLNRAGVEYNQTVRDYLELARENPPANGWTQWLEYRVATRLWLRDCLLDGVPVCELQRLLDVAGDVECQWLANNKNNKNWWPPEVPCED